MLVEPVHREGRAQAGPRSGGDPPHQRAGGESAGRSGEQKGQRRYCTSAFLKEALDRGAELFGWEERKARSGKRVGSKVRGVGVAVSTFVAGSTGFDGLFVIRPDGQMHIQSGIGNLGTETFSDVHRVAAEMMGVPWEKVVVTWGNTSQNLPWTCVSGGSQTTHAMTRAAHAAASDAIAKAKEIAAKTLGGSPSRIRSPTSACSAPARSMTLARGRAEGHRAGRQVRRPRAAEGHQQVHRGVGHRAGGAGADGRRTRHLSARRQQLLVRRRLCRSRSGCRDGRVSRVDYTAVADVGHHHPSARVRRTGARPLGAGHGARAGAEDGLRPALRARRWPHGSTRTVRRRSSTCRRG